MIQTHVYTFKTDSPKCYTAGRVISTLFTFHLVQPIIKYNVSSCLATGSNHRSNSLLFCKRTFYVILQYQTSNVLYFNYIPIKFIVLLLKNPPVKQKGF